MVLLLFEVVLVSVSGVAVTVTAEAATEADVVKEDADAVVVVTELVSGIGNSFGHPPSPR